MCPDQRFVLQEYFSDRTLDFILSHKSFSGDDALEIISTYVSAKLRSDINKVLVEHQDC